MKQAIVECFAALTEKIEDARSCFVTNEDAVLGLIEVVGEEPRLPGLQLAAFDLLRSLGRAKLTKKKILREKFTEKKINFVQRVSKQLLLCDGEEESSSVADMARQMRHMTIRVINNFGIDFKQFIFREEVMDKLVEIVSDKQAHTVERRDALMTFKNLSFEASDAE